MAQNCKYSEQLLETCHLVSAGLGRARDPLVYQSRSGPPAQPWLGPDILEHLRKISGEGRVQDVAIVPIGFVSDHMEVIYDLDTEARNLCADLGLNMVRAKTAGAHPKFIEMIRNLILERMAEDPKRICLGGMGPSPAVCPHGCCLPQSATAPAVV
jgi:ferrochelatase